MLLLVVYYGLIKTGVVIVIVVVAMAIRMPSLGVGVK